VKERPRPRRIRGAGNARLGWSHLLAVGARRNLDGNMCRWSGTWVTIYIW